MKPVLALFLGAASAKSNKNLDGTLSTVSLASLVHKPQYTLTQHKDDDDSETGYANQDTVDVSDYTSSAPVQLLQLSKNDKLDGTLSVVQIRAPKSQKMVRISDDDDNMTGYSNEATVDEGQYAKDAPVQLIQLSKGDTEGKTSVVQVKQIKYKNQSHLGEQGEEMEDNANGYTSSSAVDEDSYAKDAPSLVQLRNTKWGEVAYEDTPAALFHNMWEGTHEAEYGSDAPQDYHPDNLETAAVQLDWVGRSTFGVSADETD